MRNAHPNLSRLLIVVYALLSSAIVCLAAKHFVMPAAQPAKSYPAHDEHPSEAVTIAVDPYDMADKANIFSVHYSEVGLMPMFLVIANDGDQPVSLAGMKAEFVTFNQTKIPAATEEDIYRRISRPAGKISQNPLPLPKKVSGSMSKDTMDEVQNASYGAFSCGCSASEPFCPTERFSFPSGFASTRIHASSPVPNRSSSL